MAIDFMKLKDKTPPPRPLICAVVAAKAALWAALVALPGCSGGPVPGAPSAPAASVASTLPVASVPPIASATGLAPTTPQAIVSAPSGNTAGLPVQGMRGFVPLPPIEFVVGNKRVVVNRHRGVGRFYFVDTILVDSDTIYPPKCDAPVLPTSGLFSSSHIELRSVLGKGKDLMLVETHDGKKQRDLLFAAVFEGSPECGAYGYWLLRVGPTGTRATAPIVGCMTDPYTENTETEGEYFKESRNPIIQWGPPVSVRISDGLGSWLQFQLNSWTLDWTQISGQPVKNNNNLP